MEKQKTTQEQEMSVAMIIAKAFDKFPQDQRNTTMLYIKGVVAGVALAEDAAKNDAKTRTA